jgi:hypothetical protein
VEYGIWNVKCEIWNVDFGMWIKKMLTFHIVEYQPFFKNKIEIEKY